MRLMIGFELQTVRFFFLASEEMGAQSFHFRAEAEEMERELEWVQRQYPVENIASLLHPESTAPWLYYLQI